MKLSKALFPLTLSLIIFSFQNRAPDVRPNIIYIMADDMGYADLSLYGRKDYTTPVLDGLAREGVMFSQAYAAAPVCTPSRVAFMTGRYPARNPIGLREPLVMDKNDIDLGLSPQTATVSSLLKKAGYKTALFGKWHLGFKKEFFPTGHGFDTFFGFTPGASDYISHTGRRSRDASLPMPEDKEGLYENNRPVKKEGYLTDLITDYAINYIKETKGPFFISLQYNAPHWPWQAPGDKAYPDSVAWTAGGSTATYAKMVQRLDYGVGRVLQALEDAGLKDNTLVIFTSDNGGEKYSDMGPLKGKKLELWEGGIRVPAIVRWPGKIKPNSQTSQVAVTMDWTVTILNAAQIKLDNDLKFDGINLIPILKGETGVIKRNLYWRITNRTRSDAYRSGDWKYVKTPDSEGLYNLLQDPGETTNLKEKQEELFKKLKLEFENLDHEMLKPYIFPK